MKPQIDRTRFGSITVEGTVYRHDLLIHPDGEVLARSNELSKAVYGTSHVISLDEARQVYQEGAERLIVGGGLFGLTRLSEDAGEYLQGRGCRVDIYRIRRATEEWNQSEGAVIGLFHVSC